MFGSISIAWVLVAVLGGVVAGKLVKRRDDVKEERRRNALLVSEALTARGLTLIPEVIRDYAIGDYSSVIKSVRKAAITLNNPAAADAMFLDLYKKLHAAEMAKQAKETVTDATKPVAKPSAAA